MRLSSYIQTITVHILINAITGDFASRKYLSHDSGWPVALMCTEIGRKGERLLPNVVDAFYNFGQLTCYLFVTDLVYAGFVAWPEAADVGVRVPEVDAGALKALWQLGLVCGQAGQGDAASPQYKAEITAAASTSQDL
jgi:hypothetical protein